VSLRAIFLNMTSHAMSSQNPGAEFARLQQQAQKLDERLAVFQRAIANASEAAKKDYSFKLDLSWIHHDSALEGVVYAIPELAAALQEQPPTDASQVPAFDEIRQNKAALDLVREMATRKRLKIDLDVLKDLYVCLAPEEVEGKKPPAYRKDMPIHRLYFHEISTPDKISYKLRQFTQWVNAVETKRTTHPVRLAAKAHFQLLHIYPFPKHSGKVARLVMNLILLQNGYPPAIIHATERQRYYDALKANDNALATVVREALQSSMESAIRYFESVPAPAPEVEAPKPRTRKSAGAKKR
jgi:Fic family protein